MRIIKLFEDFNKSTILEEVDMCLVDLMDKGLTWGYVLSDYSQLKSIYGHQYGNGGAVLDISLYRDDKGSFRTSDIKDSLETMIEYFDEKYGVKSYSFRKPDSPGPGIEVKFYDEDDDSVIASYGRLKELYYLNIKINLGR